MSGMDETNGAGETGVEEVRVDIGCHIDETDKKVLVVMTGIQDFRFEFSTEKDAALADRAVTMLAVALDTISLVGKRIGEMKTWAPDGKEGGEG